MADNEAEKRQLQQYLDKHNVEARLNEVSIVAEPHGACHRFLFSPPSAVASLRTCICAWLAVAQSAGVRDAGEAV